MNFFELFKDKKLYHVSHSDLDGISARLIGEYFLKPICKEYIPLNTNFDKQLIKDFDFEISNTCDYILFTDIHPPDLEFYEKIGKEKVFIFDHHETGKDIFGDINQYYFDLNKCGTKIFYDCLLKNRRRKPIFDEYIELVDTWDMWKINSDLWNKAKHLQYVVYGYVNWRMYDFQTDTERHTNFVISHLRKLEKADKFFFTKTELDTIEKSLIKEENQYKKAKKNLQMRTDNEGNNYIYSNIDSKISLVALRLFNEYNDKIKYLVLYSDFNYKKNKTHSLSLRSQGDFSVRKLAELHGGGGHLNASGIEFSEDKEDFALSFIEGKTHLI